MTPNPLEKLRRTLSDAGVSPDAIPHRGGLITLAQAAQKAGIADDSFNGAVAKAFDIPFAESLSAYPTSSDFLAAIPIAFARRHKVLGSTCPMRPTMRPTMAGC